MSDIRMADDENEYEFPNKYPLPSDSKERLFLYHLYRALEQLAIDTYGILEPLSEYVDRLDEDDDVDEEEFSCLALDPLTRMDELQKRVFTYLRGMFWAKDKYEEGLPENK